MQLRLILFAVIVACLGVIALAKCPHHHHHHHGHDHSHQDDDDHHHQHEEEDHHHHHHHHEEHAEHHDGSSWNNMSTMAEKCMAAALGSIATSILPIVCIPLLSMLTQLLASSLAAFGSKMNLKKEQIEAFLLRWFVLLAVGAILSDLVTHMLPELGQDASHNAAQLLFAAFAGSYVLERFAQWALLDGAPASSTAHGHSHSGAGRGGRKQGPGCAGGKDHPLSKKDEKETAAEATKSAVAWVCLVTDTIHNAMDGMGIGVVTLQVAAKLTVPGLAGIWGGLSPTILAIVIHELSHEIADFAVLRSAGWSTTAIIKSQLMTAMSNFVVAVGTVVVGGSHPSLQATMEPVVAGAFLYLAFVLLREATNVPPSSVHELGADVLALGLGFAMVVACHVH